MSDSDVRDLLELLRKDTKRIAELKHALSEVVRCAAADELEPWYAEAKRVLASQPSDDDDE